LNDRLGDAKFFQCVQRLMWQFRPVRRIVEPVSARRPQGTDRKTNARRNQERTGRVFLDF
jgi:hypothetical protein